MSLECPKCKSNEARYEMDGKDLVIRCTCGYLDWVYTERGGVPKERTQKFDPLQLPRDGTQLAENFQCVVDSWPEAVNPTQILTMLKKEDNPKNFKATSTCLGILAHKKLVERVYNGNGKKGGSTFRVSKEARQYLKLPQDTQT